MSEAVHDAQRLKELQALPLERKIQITQTRIIEWYQHYDGNVCVSFSGGKDSTVLLHIARQLYPNIPAVFSNTGLEYPEIQRFVKSWDNVDIVTPSMRFNNVISVYGYPLIGKEVAEAIYYARRIRSQDVQVERERERAVRADAGEPIHKRKRTELEGKRVGSEKRPTQPQSRWAKWGGTTKERKAEIHAPRVTQHGRGNQQETKSRDRWSTYEPFQRDRWILHGFRSTAGVEPFKSQFNKEKWLPLARDVPVLISHYCCFKMKKSPMHKYQTAHGYKPILATLAEESRIRKQGWIRHGCNAFESKNPMSQPMSFWTEQDVLAYIVKYNVPIASVYGEIVSDHDGIDMPPVDMLGNPGCNLKCTGCERTGCLFCGFGMHLEKGETRFQRLAKTHPRQYEFSIGGGQFVDNPHYDATAPEYDGEWKNWNPKQIWVPSKKGLGMGKVFDMVNENYGKDFYRYD